MLHINLLLSDSKISQSINCYGIPHGSCKRMTSKWNLSKYCPKCLVKSRQTYWYSIHVVN